MTRAPAIDAAARALVSSADWDLLGLSAAESELLATLERALALPEEESEVAFLVQRAGSGLACGLLTPSLPLPESPMQALIHINRRVVRRVRVTVEPGEAS